MPSLFDDDFIRAADSLRIRARQVPAGGRHGEHRSRTLGAGMEFRDFRSYTPGDDLRRVDWNLYARSGKLFLRLFDEPRSLPVYVLLDNSDSMYFETPPRADAAKRIAGLFAAIALNDFDSAAIHPFGADLAKPLASLSGRQNVRRVLGFLDSLVPSGPTNLVKALRKFALTPMRAGLLLIVSDFFEPQGLDAVADALRSVRHKIGFIQLTHASDASPVGEGEYRMTDCESGASVEVAMTPAVLDRYRRAYEAFNRQLDEMAGRRNAAHLRLDAGKPVLDQIGELFRNRVFVT